MAYKSGREASIFILSDILKNSAYINDALSSGLNKSALSAEDKGFATTLVYGVMRNLMFIDYVIGQFSKIKLKKISDNILQIIRISVYQLYFLDNIPKSAVCNEAVKLAKRYGHSASASFCNAILRNIASSNRVLLPDKEKEPLFYLSLKYSYPVWLLKLLVLAYSFDFTESFCASTMENQSVTLRVNSLKDSRDNVLARLKEIGMKAEKGRVSADSIVLFKSGSIEKIDDFKNGYVTVQDESSQLVARVLSPETGQNVLDLCSAPGGKTTHISELMENTGSIIACDIHEHKLNIINLTAKRLGITNIETVLNDSAKFNKSFVNRFDRVLCDVPCSGFGLVAKKPDIKYNKTQDDVLNIIKIKKNILDNAASYVKPGGFLVYSTCTVNPEENINQINRFLSGHPNFRPSEISGIEYKIDTLSEGYISLFPNTDGTDGFFIYKLQRIE